MNAAEVDPWPTRDEELAQLQELGGHLTRFGWPEWMLVNRGSGALLVSGWRSEAGSFEVSLSILDTPPEIALRVRNVALADPLDTPDDRLTRVLLLLASTNYELRRGTWSYDPSDGEIAFTVSTLNFGEKVAYEVTEALLRTAVACTTSLASGIRAALTGFDAPLDSSATELDALLRPARVALAAGDTSESERLLDAAAAALGAAAGSRLD